MRGSILRSYRRGLIIDVMIVRIRLERRSLIELSMVIRKEGRNLGMILRSRSKHIRNLKI